MIARGVERRPIFRYGRDREDFVKRVARLAVKLTRHREAERLMGAGRAEELPGLAEKVAKRLKVPVERLGGAGRSAAVSAARREVIRREVLGRRIRPVDVSRYLGISTAAVAQHLRACEQDSLAT